MIEQKMINIRMLLLDVDGVLTAGEVIYSDAGEEIKIFNVKDGLGIRLLMEAGIKVGIVTGRSSEALLHRCRNLKIDLLFDGVKDKSVALQDIIKKTAIPVEQIAFVGDDLPDIPIMKKCGFSVAVKDAHENVRSTADMITSAGGGRGAVREVCEAILKARKLWDPIVEKLF